MHYCVDFMHYYTPIVLLSNNSSVRQYCIYIYIYTYIYTVFRMCILKIHVNKHNKPRDLKNKEDSYLAKAGYASLSGDMTICPPN